MPKCINTKHIMGMGRKEHWKLKGGDLMKQVKKIELDYHTYPIDKMIEDIEKLNKKYPKAKIYIRVKKG